MSKISIRPDMRTPGGEISDVVLNGRYVGGMSLVYREGNRLSGSIQLEKTSLSSGEKRKVIGYLQEYVNSLAAAIDAVDCDVVVTYSHFDQVIVMEHNIGEIESFIDHQDEYDEDYEVDYGRDDPNIADIGPDQSVETYEMRREDIDSPLRMISYQEDHGRTEPMGRGDRPEWSGRGRQTTRAYPVETTERADRVGSDPSYPAERAYEGGMTEHAHAYQNESVGQYELVITGEHGDSVEYHVYGANRRWLADIFVTIYDADCIGEISWMIDPTPDQIESVVDLLVSDFDEDLVDTFRLEIKRNGELLELFELDHQDIVDYEEEVADTLQATEPYSVHLVRDDHDTLTYDIYSNVNGGFPISTATIDISQREITGFMDFREMSSEEDREKIVTLLMRELDKEKDYDSFNITVLYKNRPIDEMLFENEPLQ